MKALLRKIPAMIAMLITLASVACYVLPAAGLVHHEYWILSVILAVLSMPFFFIDAIISFVRALKKEDSKFNYLLALVLVGGIPMLLIFGQVGIDSFNVIWNVYYLLMFVLEVISIKKACVAMKANRKQAKESAEG